MKFEKLKRYAEENLTDEEQLEKLKKFQQKINERIRISKVEVNKYIQSKKEEADREIEKLSFKFALTNQEDKK